MASLLLQNITKEFPGVKALDDVTISVNPGEVHALCGENGSIHLTKDCELHITTRSGTEIIAARPKEYPWADAKYSLIHSSIVDCNRNILDALTGRAPAETTGSDNFETVRLVHASYTSARTNTLIDMKTF